jgi:hypothetical protein
LLELEKRRPVFKTYPELQQLHDFLSWLNSSDAPYFL